MSIVRKIKEEVSGTGQRALGLDGIRFNLQVVLEKLEKLHQIEADLSEIKVLSQRIQALSAQLNQLNDQPQMTTRDHALRRLLGHQISIATLIDVGASNGFWSKAFARYFPGRHHLLVDANAFHLEELKKVCRQNPKWQFALTAVGDTTGELYFDASDPLGGVLSATPWTKDYRPCPVTTIDHLVEKYPLPGPFMIKLDTHGVELPILEIGR